jgi:hypothetical protein
MIKKSIPSDSIIKILTEEINTYGMPFSRDIPVGKITKAVFDAYKDIKIEHDAIKKADMSLGTYDMNRKQELPIKQVMAELGAHSCTNTVIYAKNSGIDWHTNSDNVGKRIYIIFTVKPGIFRYKDPITGEIIDDMDYVGWTQREFIVDKTNLLWHCVYSPGIRFAYGFNVKP